MISPRSDRDRGTGRASARRASGIDGMVRTFAVTSSPSVPLPRVTPRTSRPRSYTSSIEAPSSLGSSR